MVTDGGRAVQHKVGWPHLALLVAVIALACVVAIVVPSGWSIDVGPRMGVINDAADQ